MKVNDNSYSKNILSTEKSKNISKAEADKNSKKTENSKNINSESVKVELSNKAQEFNKIKEIAQTSPDIRTDKISKLKELIKNGQYKVDAEKIADKMLHEETLNELLLSKKS